MIFKRVGIILISLLLIGGLGGCMNNSDKKEILSYLEEKYNESFVIENFKSGNKLVNKYGGDEAILHVKDNENLVFSAGTRANKDGGYYDNYLLIKWANDLNDDFNYVIKENIESNYDYKVSLYSASEHNAEELINMSYKEYMNYAKDDIRISLELFIDVNENKDFSIYYEGIYNILNNIKSYNTGMYDLAVGFTKDSNDKAIQEHLRLANVTEEDIESIDSDIVGKIIVTFLNKVENPEDLRQYYINLGE